MTSRPFVLFTLIITLSSACSALGQPDLADSASSVPPQDASAFGGRPGEVPDDLAFSAGSAEQAAPGGGSTFETEEQQVESGAWEIANTDGSGPQPGSTSQAGPNTAPAPTLETAAESPVETQSVAITPNAALFGVELGTDAVLAVAQLVESLGVPDLDTGWYVGCPLDGEALDERLVQWGDLNAYFDRSGGDGTFVAWGYDLRIADGGLAVLDLVELPGGSRLGDPINEVASAAGLALVTDDVFGVNRVGGGGFEILSDPPLGAPAWGVFVPSIPLCD